MKLNINDVIGYIVLIAGVVSFIASALMKYDKKHAALWSDLHNAADAIVAQQAITNKTNEVKKADGTIDLVNQMHALGHNKVTQEVAKGVIEQSVTKAKQDNVLVNDTDKVPNSNVNERSLLLDDLHL